MASPLKGTDVARAAIVGVLCVLIDVSSEERQAATLFSFSISSRRNSTGHRHIRAVFNTPDPIFSRNAGGDETLFDVKQNINIEGNKKVIQLILSVVVLADERRPPFGYERVPGVGWYRLHLTPLTWEEARLACEAEGAHLAVLNSQEEAKALKNIFAKERSSELYAFVGFSDLKDGRYLTIFGETLHEAGFDS
ncbi:hypothetical protein R5R35_009041 [Gryllus longicercus]|uniref:C-type lectin domain-containing protein n=1 Tax=Gryllus longicercus TaxID=2509291 RepID=A0AAN9VUI4_9ORTH